MTTKRKPWKMQAKAGVGEIFLYDDIGDSFFGDATSAKEFADELKALGDIATLNLFINSPGGSVFHGVAIYNILRRHQARKVVSIDGLAASIASVIAMAGDERSIAANGMIMIHDPWSIAFGTAEDMRKTADSLDKVRSALLDTYVERTTTAETEISDMMSAETWMTAEEALDLGFVDTIGAEIEIAAKFDLSGYHNPPPALIEVMATADPPAEPPKPYLKVVQSRERLARRKITRRAEPAPTAA